MSNLLHQLMTGYGGPESALRKWHYRPLDRSLTQPFAKQVNRPVSDAYRWG